MKKEVKQEMKKQEGINKIIEKLLLFAVPVLVLALPLLFRLGKPMPGYESYFFINKFHFLPEILLRLMPFIFAFLSLALFYFLLKQLGFKKEMCTYSTILLSASAPFIYASSFFTYDFVLIFLVLLGFFLYIKKQKLWFILSIPVLLSTVFFNMYAFVPITFILAYSLTKKEKIVPSIILSSIMLILSLLLLPEHNFLVTGDLTQHFVFEFGSLVGFGISYLMLFVFGFVLSWKLKYRLVYVYLAMAVLAVLSRFLFFMQIYLNLFVVVFASLAVSELLKSRWSFKQLKSVAVIAVICTILFSALSYAFVIKNMQPDENVVKSLKFLKTLPDGRVFSHPSKGFWIEYYSGKNVFADTLALNNDLQDTANNLYYSRSFSNSTKILNESKIKYFWIDNEMLEGQVWTKPAQGLLFLFVDKNLFKQVYNNSEVEIWEYIQVQNQSVNKQ